MPPLNVMIKPASSNCNLDCNYCFYHSLSDSREVKSYGRMSEDLLEEIVTKAFQYADRQCTFAFQGGEPTLAGLDFYQHLLELIAKYKPAGLQVNKVIQTNGTLIDPDWANFLAANDFLVGISLDGPEEIHNQHRVDRQGAGSYQQVMEAIELFKETGVEYNILTVVNAQVARQPQKIYDFFKQQGFKYLQFIKCLDPLGEERGQHQYSLTPDLYGNFLNQLFEEWYQDLKQGRQISIKYFDNLVQMMLGYPPGACEMRGECSLQYIIEADGGVYPCDFYVTDEWRLGNITETTFSELKNKPLAEQFISTSQTITAECKSCPYVRLCRGGCRRNQEPLQEGEPQLNYFCSAYKEFFAAQSEKLQELARLLAR